MREEHDIPLSGLTTMRVGGPAQRLVTVETTDDLVDAIREVDDADEPLLVGAGGSSLVVADQGFAGSVVRVATSGVWVESADSGEVTVRVAAGEVWDDVVLQAVAQGWSGIEALSGIPGAAGATPIQNVGAYGQEVAQSIASVRVWDRGEQQVRTFANPDCQFTYRHSLFKSEPRYVVLDVVFQLHVTPLSGPVARGDLARALGVGQGEQVPLAQAREAVLAQRHLLPLPTPQSAREIPTGNGPGQWGHVELEHHVQDDVAWLGLEQRVAVGELTVRIGEGADLLLASVPDANRGDALGDLLAVCPNVLDGSRTRGAGDAGEGLDAGPALGDRLEDHVVPDLTGGNANRHLT